MPSELGKFIRATRQARGIGLRELARRIEKSAPFLSELELDDNPAPASEDTLRSLATALGVEADQLFALAKRLPKELMPETEAELALYRRVKAMSPSDQAAMLQRPEKGRKRK